MPHDSHASGRPASTKFTGTGTSQKSHKQALPETVILEKSAEPTVESCKRFSRVHSPRDRLTVHVKPFADSGQRSSAILTVSSPTFLAMNSETACCKPYGPDLDSSILAMAANAAHTTQADVSLVGGALS